MAPIFDFKTYPGPRPAPAATAGDMTSVLRASEEQNVPDTQLISQNNAGDNTDDFSYAPAISGDGRMVAFHANSSERRSSHGQLNDVFVFDRETRETACISDEVYGPGVSVDAESPAISGDGARVAFSATAVDARGDRGATQIFVYDAATRQRTLLTAGAQGVPADAACENPAMSADGLLVAFDSAATNLCGPGGHDVFVHDGHGMRRVSVASDGSLANGSSSHPAVAANGNAVAFASRATNLVPGDTNAREDIFVHERSTGTTTRVSVASDGTEGDGPSQAPSMSADGRMVAFASEATNLVPGDDNNRSDVFVHDRQTGVTRRVSVASDGTQANDKSYWPSISADGRYVAFYSDASNLVPGDYNGRGDVFVHDLTSGETRRVSVAVDGAELDDTSYSPAMSADGFYVAFGSMASNAASDKSNRRPGILAVRNVLNAELRQEILRQIVQSAADAAAAGTAAGRHEGHIVREDDYIDIDGVRVPRRK